MKNVLLVILGIAVTFATPAIASEGMVTLKWIDEEGQPLSGIQVQAGFEGDATQQMKTDTNGLCVLNGKTYCAEVAYCAKPDGFYYSQGRYKFRGGIKDGKNQPWNPVVTTAVRKIISPIPMSAKKVRAVIPVLDEFVGYDLMEADWIAPYGKGKIGDIIFRMKKRYVSIQDFDSSLDLALTNAVDGVQETSLNEFQVSDFRLLRFAPSDGYAITNLNVSESSTNYFHPDENQAFYFRVRTVTNESGRITSALYGKIRSYIGFDVRRDKTGVVNFTYYLNPTPNDRNLEFDPKRNLSTNLKPGEQVTAP